MATGIPTFISTAAGNVYGITDFDSAVGWAHTYTAEANVLNTTCQNCHGVNGVYGPKNPNSTPAQWTKVAVPGTPSLLYLGHAYNGRTSRQMMDKAETLVAGNVLGTSDGSDGVCVGCHANYSGSSGLANCSAVWKQHLTQGRVAESVWEDVSLLKSGTRCGW